LTASCAIEFGAPPAAQTDTVTDDAPPEQPSDAATVTDPGAPPDPAVADCTVKQSSGADYWFCNDEMTWEEARTTCLGFGLDLVTVRGPDEDLWLSETFGVDQETSFWLGIHDRLREGHYSWPGGPSSFASWCPFEPNGFTGENCVERAWCGWNDIPCTLKRKFVCAAAECTPATDADAATTICPGEADKVCPKLSMDAAGQTEDGQARCLAPCDDGQDCTDDSASPLLLSCTHQVREGACDDTNPCTGDDTCKSGICVGTPQDSLCSDGDSCTEDMCITCPNYYDGSCYEAHRIDGFQGFGLAAAACAESGGHLATIHSLEESDFIRNVVGTTAKRCWIGLKLQQKSASWVTGEPVTYAPWLAGQPGPTDTGTLLQIENGLFEGQPPKNGHECWICESPGACAYLETPGCPN